MPFSTNFHLNPAPFLTKFWSPPALLFKVFKVSLTNLLQVSFKLIFLLILYLHYIYINIYHFINDMVKIVRNCSINVNKILILPERLTICDPSGNFYSCCNKSCVLKQSLWISINNVTKLYGYMDRLFVLLYPQLFRGVFDESEDQSNLFV